MIAKLWNKHTESALSNYKRLATKVNVKSHKTLKDRQISESSMSNDSEERKIKLIKINSIKDETNNQTQRSSQNSAYKYDNTHITVDKWNNSMNTKFSNAKSKMDSNGANNFNHSSFYKVMQTIWFCENPNSLIFHKLIKMWSMRV